MKTGMTLFKERDGIKAYIEISDSDIVRLTLDSFDRALMGDVGLSAPPEDLLLVFEMLFRRINEQEPKP